MSTFIINLNDTIAMSDSAMVELAKIVSASKSCEAGTNCHDVTIVAIICGTVVLLAIIVAIVITIWHNKEVKNRREMETEKASNAMTLKQNEALQKETEEWNRLVRYFQKSVFDKIIAKKNEEEEFSKEEDWKNLQTKIKDFINDIFIRFKV